MSVFSKLIGRLAAPIRLSPTAFTRYRGDNRSLRGNNHVSRRDNLPRTDAQSVGRAGSRHSELSRSLPDIDEDKFGNHRSGGSEAAGVGQGSSREVQRSWTS